MCHGVDGDVGVGYVVEMLVVIVVSMIVYDIWSGWCIVLWSGWSDEYWVLFSVCGIERQLRDGSFCV